MKKISKFFFCPFAPLFFFIFLEKIHHILCSIGPFINFELSEVKIRQKLDKKCEIFKFGDFFPKIGDFFSKTAF